MEKLTANQKLQAKIYTDAIEYLTDQDNRRAFIQNAISHNNAKYALMNDILIDMERQAKVIWDLLGVDYENH